MKSLRRFVLIGLLAAFSPAAFPQSLPNLSLARLAYTVRKRTVDPQGEMKQKIDANDHALADATRLGNIGEVRRLLAKGMTLLSDKPWTDELDYGSSLTLRSDQAFADSSKPYAVRLEQIYMPSIALEQSLTARVTLRKPGNRANPAGDVVKDFGAFEDVSRDLRESPYLIEMDLSDVPNGYYIVRAEVMDGSRALGSASTRMVARKNLDTSLASLEKEGQSVPDSLRADVLYPADYIHNVNRGRIDIGMFDISKELADAAEIARSASAGKNPFAGRTGDMKRHYFFKDAGEIMPYRLFVPSRYDGSKAFPLIVALHGLGGSENSMFGQNYGMLDPAEKRGYIVVAPLGYRLDGFYGRTPDRRSQLSEMDVMNVLALVRKEYKIDPDRIYLMGHSMGGIGTWTLGAKHPEIWAALGPISGVADPKTVAVMRHIPEVVVHGDADNTVPVSGSRNMVDEMKRLGTEVKYIEVPGGSHTSVPGSNMPAIFDFFDTHKRQGSAPSAQR